MARPRTVVFPFASFVCMICAVSFASLLAASCLSVKISTGILFICLGV